MKREIIPWSAFSEVLHARGQWMPFVVIARLTEIIIAIVKDEFGENIPAEVIARALEIPNPEKATWENGIALYITELKRLARAAARGAPVASPVEQLAILSAGDPSLITDQPGVPRDGLALALGLPESATVSEILAFLDPIADQLWPDEDLEFEIQRRAQLLRLNTLAAEHAALAHRASGVNDLRRSLIATLSTGAEKFTPARAIARGQQITQDIQQLTDSQILNLSIAMLAASPNPGRRSHPQIVTLRASNGAKPGALPARLKVLGWGANQTLKGEFIVDDQTLAVFDANQARVGRERVALDFEHNTVPGSDEFKRTSEPRAVAAYWTPRVIHGEGILLEAPAWTPQGETNALNFEDISAAPFVENNRVIGLHSVALTRAGASEFTFLSADIPGAQIVSLSSQKISVQPQQLSRGEERSKFNAAIARFSADVDAYRREHNCSLEHAHLALARSWR